MAPPFLIPDDVKHYIRSVFSHLDDRVSTSLSNAPNQHEEALDFLLISSIAERAIPFKLSSEYTVSFGLHFIGGGHHIERRWEIADVGVVVNYTRAGVRVRTKLVLLQSKRLYPREVDFVEVDPIAKPGGYGALAMAPVFPAEHERTFSFDDSCRYNALQVGDDQWQRIAQYEQGKSAPVHYLLYHPRELPFRQVVPLTAERWVHGGQPVSLGVRVVRASSLRSVTGDFSRNTAPSFGDIRSAFLKSAPSGDIGFGWPLSEFMSEQVIDCHEGYVAESSADEVLNAVFNLRGAPIRSAFRIDIDAPESAEVVA